MVATVREHGDGAAGTIIDGRAYAAELMEEVKDGVARPRRRRRDRDAAGRRRLRGAGLPAPDRPPRGARPAIFSRAERLPARRARSRACSRCSTSSTATRACPGILVLRPLPPHLPESDVLRALPRLKDVEAQHPENAGLLALGTPRFTPSTAAAAFHMLDRYMAEAGRDPALAYDGLDLVVVGPLDQRGQAGRDPRPRPQRDRHLRATSTPPTPGGWRSTRGWRTCSSSPRACRA